MNHISQVESTHLNFLKPHKSFENSSYEFIHPAYVPTMYSIRTAWMQKTLSPVFKQRKQLFPMKCDNGDKLTLDRDKQTECFEAKEEED